MLNDRQKIQDEALNEVASMFDGDMATFARIVRFLMPDCRICEDDDGQIVIYTGACVQMGGEIDVWEPEDEDAYRAWESRHPEIV
jgi:hypothetical protein